MSWINSGLHFIINKLYLFYQVIYAFIYFHITKFIYLLFSAAYKLNLFV